MKKIISKTNAQRVDNIFQSFSGILFPHGKILFHDDFYVPISTVDTQPAPTNIVNLNFEYNIFIGLFVDQVVISYSQDGEEYEVCSVNIEEQLNAEERRIFHSIKGLIKNAKDRIQAETGMNYVAPQDIISNLNSLISSFFRDPESVTQDGIESIFSKYSLANMSMQNEQTTCSVFTDHICVEDDTGRSFPVPLSTEIKDILEKKSNFSLLDGTGIHQNFSKTCYQLIERGIDPIQAFIDVKPFSTLPQKRIKEESEKNLIARFILEAACLTPENERIRSLDLDSGISKRNGLHNFKRMSKIVKLNSTIQNFTISFVSKSSDNNRACEITKILGEPIDCQEHVLRSLASFDYGRRNLKVNFPCESGVSTHSPTSEDVSSLVVESIFGDILEYDNTERKFYFCDRAVISSDFNGDYVSSPGYSVVEASNYLDNNTGLGRNINKRELPISSKYIISRKVISGLSRGEIFVKSRILESKLISTIYGNEYSNIEDKLRGMSILGFCVSRENAPDARTQDNYSLPINKIIICNINPELYISNITFESKISGKSKLPFMNEDIRNGELQVFHLDPIPGEVYEYTVNFSDENSGLITKNAKLVTKVKTLSISTSPVKLGPREIISTELGTKYRIPLNNESLRSYRNNQINSLLDDIFPVSNQDARSTFGNRVDKLLNDDLSFIGNSFKLLVNGYDKKSGLPLEIFGRTTIVEATVDESQNRYFDIEYPDNISALINYNLIATNPFHDILQIDDELQEGTDSEKTRYLRKTSKYFNTITLNSGILPGPNRLEPVEFLFNSPINTSISSDLNRLLCVGDAFTVDSSSYTRNEYSLKSFDVTPDNIRGEFTLRWEISYDGVNPIPNEKIDFYVITAMLHKNEELPTIEVPISAFPFIADSSGNPVACSFRTETFNEVTRKVMFKIYIVTTNFNILDIGIISRVLNISSKIHHRVGRIVE